MPLKSGNDIKIRNFDIPVSYRINESRSKLKDALNVFSNQGRLETRFGRSVYNETALGGPILSLSYFKTASNVRYILAKVGTTLYKVNASGAATSIKTGLTSTTKHRGITWARGSSSRHIISIEGDGLFQWDGTTFTQLGQNPPVGHTVTTTTGTLANGTYRVHITFYSSTTGFESNSSFSGEITTTAQGIKVDDIPTTADNATIDKVKIYLEDMGSPDDPLYCGEVALGVDTFNITEDPTSAETRPLANAAPSSGGGRFMTEFNSMLVYAGNDTFKNDVFFSEPDLPDAFNDGTAPDRLVYYAKGDGAVTGLATGLYNNSVLDPYLVIFKRRQIEIFSIINGEERGVTIPKIGCVAHNTIIVKNGDVYFLSDSGWRVISNGRLVTDDKGNAATLGLGDIDDIFHQPGFTYEINKAQAENAFAAYYATLDQYLTWIPEGGSIEMTKTYNYEFKVGGFKPYEFNTPSTAACTGEDADGDEVVYMADANGRIYKHSTKESRGADHDSSGVDQPVNAFALLTWVDGDDMDASYNWRELFLRRIAGSGDLLVRAFVNFNLDSSGDTYLFESDEEGFQLDVDTLDDTALLEGGRSIETSRADINQSGENLLLGFYQNAIGTNMGLTAAQVSFNKNGNRNK